MTFTGHSYHSDSGLAVPKRFQSTFLKLSPQKKEERDPLAQGF